MDEENATGTKQKIADRLAWRTAKKHSVAILCAEEKAVQEDEFRLAVNTIKYYSKVKPLHEEWLYFICFKEP